MPSDLEPWCGTDHRDQNGHHRAADEWFLGRHPPAPDGYVVDLGCGTGEFTARLAELVPRGQVVGVEPDESVLAVARARERPNLRFVAGRAQELYLAVPPGRADLVVSRAVFHRVPLADYPRCYAAIATVLRPGGWLHAESGGAGNVARVLRTLDTVAAEWGLPPARVTFPDAGAAYDLVVAAGLEVPEGGVLTVAQRRGFDRDRLLGFLRTQAVLGYLGGAREELVRGFCQAVANRVDELANPDGSYDQTFVRLDVLARRPEPAPARPRRLPGPGTRPGGPSGPGRGPAV
jgi:trans-aconitate methyltransferase